MQVLTISLCESLTWSKLLSGLIRFWSDPEVVLVWTSLNGACTNSVLIHMWVITQSMYVHYISQTVLCIVYLPYGLDHIGRLYALPLFEIISTTVISHLAWIHLTFICLRIASDFEPNVNGVLVGWTGFPTLNLI